MTIAREEIFGPALAILRYSNVGDAIRIANDTRYGLSAYVQGGDMERVRKVGERIRAGQVTLNASALDIDLTAPFGGYTIYHPIEMLAMAYSDN